MLPELNRAEAEIALHRVDHRIAVEQLIGHVVEIWLQNIPALYIPNLHGIDGSTGGEWRFKAGARLSIEGDGGAQGERLWQFVDSREECNASHAIVCGDLHAFQIHARHKFKPHRLPDASGTRVEAAFGMVFIALLAMWLLAAPLMIHSVNNQRVFARMHIFGNIKLEGAVAAPVRSALLAVEKGGACIVHRSEMQEDAPCKLLVCQYHRAPVPDGFHKIPIFNAGQLRFRAKRNEDRFVKVAVRAAAFAVIDSKFPCPIEVLPSAPNKLWAWIFPAREVRQMNQLLFLLPDAGLL